MQRLRQRRGRQRPSSLLRWGWLLVLVLSGRAHAQNTDTLVLENSRKFTVIDQIADPAERNALLKIYRARTPRARAEAGDAFLQKYPQSWLLPEIYELAAKAYIDLGELDRALPDGRASLRILPESPCCWCHLPMRR